MFYWEKKFTKEVALALDISEKDALKWFGDLSLTMHVDELVRLVRILEEEGKGKRWKPIDYSIR